MLASLLIVLLVEPTNEFLEYGAYGVIVEPGVLDQPIASMDRSGLKVDLRVDELRDQRAEVVRL